MARTDGASNGTAISMPRNVIARMRMVPWHPGSGASVTLTLDPQEEAIAERIRRLNRRTP